MKDSDPQPTAGRSTAALALQALDQMRGLLRRELDLARAEGEARLRGIAGAMALGAGAVVLAVTALDTLTGALVGFLVEQGADPLIASIGVGAAWLALAGIMALRARSALAAPKGDAKKASAHMKADFRAARGVRDNGA